MAMPGLSTPTSSSPLYHCGFALSSLTSTNRSSVILRNSTPRLLFVLFPLRGRVSELRFAVSDRRWWRYESLTALRSLFHSICRLPYQSSAPAASSSRLCDLPHTVDVLYDLRIDLRFRYIRFESVLNHLDRALQRRGCPRFAQIQRGLGAHLTIACQPHHSEPPIRSITFRKHDSTATVVLQLVQPASV